MPRSLKLVGIGTAVLVASGLGYLQGLSLAGLTLAYFAVGQVRLGSASGRELSLLPGVVLASLIYQFSPADISLALLSGLMVTLSVHALGGGVDRSRFTLVTGATSFLMVGLWTSADAATLLTFEYGGVIPGGTVLTIAALAIAWLATSVLLEAFVTREDGQTVRRQFRTRFRETPFTLVLLSASVLLAAMWPYSLFWSIVISVGPFAVVYGLLKSVTRAKKIEELTIRALGKLPEAAGLTPTSHTADAASLAVSMGVIFGLGDDALHGLHRAAILHDIGLLYCGQPNGTHSGYFEADKAKWGAEILESSRALVEEAKLIRHTGTPYRIPGFDPNPQVDPRSQIIRVACAFQSLVALGVSVDDAVELLYSERFDLSPWAVETIRPAIRLNSSAQENVTR